jgi:WD40 repeat protein
MAIDRLRDLLNAIGPPVTPLELAEMLWLADHLPAGPDEEAASREPADSRPPDTASRETGPAGSPGDELAAPAAGEADASRTARQSLYAPRDAANGGEGTEAESLLVPTAPMLNQTLALQRALRPFKRRVPSRRRRVLDENATAEKIARHPWQRPWAPVLAPSRERWLSLALVVDTGPAMAVWQPLVGELREALFRLGAFRDVRVWLLAVGHGAGAPVGVRAAAGAPVLAPSALADPTGRQAVVILSDCSGRHWWDGRTGVAAHWWARQGPTVILQPLGEGLWRRTAAPTVPGQALLDRPGAPNTELHFTPHDGPVRPPPGSIPVPVTELSADWLADWARLVAGSGGPRDTAVTYVTERARPAVAPLTAEEQLPPADRVRRFQAAASPAAAELAAHIAVAVPYLPVMRLIQHRIVSPSQPADLAEVLLSGLLRPVDGVPGLYDFLPGARDALLRTLPRGDSLATAAVLERVAAEIQERAGTAAQTFRAVMNVAAGTGSLPTGDGDRPFALIDAGALRLLTHVTALEAAGPRPVAGPPDGQAGTGREVTANPAEAVPAVTYTGRTDDGRSFTLRLPPRLPERGWPGQDMADLPVADADELTGVLSKLDPARPNRVPVLIEGPAGTGKTALATQAVRSSLERGWFPGGVLYARRPAVLADTGEMARTLLRNLGVPEELIPDATENRVRDYRALLAAYAAQNRRILLVIDDAVNAAEAKLLLPDDQQTGVIVISRRHLGVEPAYRVRRELPEEPVFVPAPPLPPGRRMALIIATGRYEDPALRELPSAVRDAEELAAVLGDPEIGGFAVTMLSDRTALRLSREIESFLRDRRPDETVLVYLAGQGIQDDARGGLFFAVADTETAFPPHAPLRATELIRQLGECRAQRQILILDLGTMLTLDRSLVDIDISPSLTAGDASSPRVSRNAGKREILAAVPDIAHPVRGSQPIPVITKMAFTNGMVEGLRTGSADSGKDGHITVQEAYRHAYNFASDRSSARQTQLWTSGSQDSTVLARSPAGRAVTPAPLPEVMVDGLRASSSTVRTGAVLDLEEWLADPDLARAVAAYQALRDVAENDIPEVAQVAASALSLARPAATPVSALPPTRREQPSREQTSPDTRRRPLDSLSPVIMEQDPDEASCVAFSPDGRLIASGARGRPVRFLEVSTGRSLPPLSYSQDRVRDVAFSPDGRQFVTAGDGGGHLWYAADGTPAGPPVLSLDTTTGVILAIAFSPDGALVAGAGTEVAVHIWRVADPPGTLMSISAPAPVSDVTFSPDGTLVAAACEDGVARAWRAEDGNPAFTVKGPVGEGTSVAFSPDDGTLLAFGGEYGLVLQHVPTGVATNYLDAAAAVHCVAFSPDGALLAAGCADGAIRVWQAATGERLAELANHNGPVLDVAFSPTGLMIASAGRDGSIQLWR